MSNREKLFLFIAVFILLFLFPVSVKAVGLEISNPEVSNDEITLQVSVTDLAANSCPNTVCYLQGMMTQLGSNPSYFGFTENNHKDWYKYDGSPTKDEVQSTFFSFTPQGGNWSGMLKVKNDPDDPDYIGPGDYILKVRRYTGNSDSGSPTSEKSTDLQVTLSFVIPATEAPTQTDTPASTSTPTTTSTATATPTKKITPTPTVTEIVQDTNQDNSILGLRSGLTVDSPTAGVSGETNGNKLPPVALILIVAGALVLGVSGFAFIKKVREDKRSPNEQNPPVS